MPRTGQIIPEWLHPHEAVYINDNTRYEDIAFRQTGPVFLNATLTLLLTGSKNMAYLTSVNTVSLVITLMCH